MEHIPYKGKVWEPKQTAVEYLFEEIKKLTGLNIASDELIVDQAKEMEKQQIIDAWNTKSRVDGILVYNDNRSAEQYYNENFKKQ